MLRPYQIKAIKDTEAAWMLHQNALLALPTGGGKTYIFTTIVKNYNIPTCVIAHRQELLGQMSLSLGEMGVAHRIIASDKAVNEITKAHRIKLGKIWFDPTAPTICASVDTLIRRDARMLNGIKMWIIDEAHHILEENKWGRAVDMMPKDARGLGVTATPMRADGKGLGSMSDGVFDVLVQGPTGQELIDQGYLSPYQVFTIPVKDLDLSEVKRGKTGDLVAKQLRTATKSSQMLIGSIVETYQKNVLNKRGITFCVDIEHAEETAYRFQQAGVKAQMVSGETPLISRILSMEKFRRGEIQQLVNVDLFGEGLDVPDVESVHMARKTMSFPLYSQQCGRAFRPVYAPNWPLDTAEQRKAAIAAGPKPKASVFDHVGNVLEHGLPTDIKSYSLLSRGDASRGESLTLAEKLKSCTYEKCFRPYPAYLTACPHCGKTPKVSPRSSDIEEIEGDLVLLTPDVILQLSKEAERVVSQGVAPSNLSTHAVLGILKRHNLRAEAQKELRQSISQWAGYCKMGGLTIRESQKKFYLKFGIDVLTAQTLSAKEAKELKERIEL